MISIVYPAWLKCMRNKISERISKLGEHLYNDPSIDAVIENLETFFSMVKRGNVLLIWEPRGNWTPGEVRNLCRELDLIHGVDPFTADPQWGPVRYFRLHGITGYRYRFSGKDLEKLQEKCRGLTYCFFNNVNMWADALAFQDRVQKS